MTLEAAQPSIYKTINKIQSELNKTGITKSHKNAQQGYSFRGIDDVYNALSPLLAEHGLCILPRMLSRTVVERATKAGGALFSVVVEAEFDFVAVSDGSKHVVKTYGEAMDSADKATNKAMSAAYKYACVQAFSIPTEGDNDADAHTPEVVLRKAQVSNDYKAPAPSAAAVAVFKPKAEGDSEFVTTFIPAKVTTKSGTGSKGNWTKWSILDNSTGEDIWFGTFDETLGGLASEGEKKKKALTISWEYDKSGKYRNALDIFFETRREAGVVEEELVETPF